MTNNKTGYVFSKETGEYIGTELVYLEVRTGNYPHADNVTFIEPPKTGEHQKQRWNGAGWDIVADYRGVIYYNTKGEIVGMITDLGDIEDKIIKEPPRIDTFHELSWGNNDWNITLKKDCIEKDGMIRYMIQPERILAGLEELPDNMKIVDGEVFFKDRDDLFNEGKMTIEEYNKEVDEERQLRFSAETDKMGLMYLRGECTKEEWVAAMDKIREELPKKE